MAIKSHPIGIFDSGLGGLTVAKEILSSFPNESIVYFGDTARLPYGTKSRETIIRYSKENANFLQKHNVKMIVIACNTATAFALESLREELSIPVIGVIKPGAKKAVGSTVTGKIGVIATKATVSSNAYESEILALLPSAKVVQVACPLFVPFVEEGLLTHPAMKLLVEDYLSPLKDAEVDTVLLGCTHYPLLLDLLSEFFGEKVRIVDSATTCAKHVGELLLREEIAASQECVQAHQYFVSDAPSDFLRLGHLFLGMDIADVGLHLN